MQRYQAHIHTIGFRVDAIFATAGASFGDIFLSWSRKLEPRKWNIGLVGEKWAKFI